MEWFRAFSDFGKVLCIIGLSTTVILVIQLIMLIIGLETGDANFDASPDVSNLDEINDEGFLDFFGLRLITFRGIIAFFAVGSWTALGILKAADSIAWSIVAGLASGLIALLLVAYAMKKLNDFQETGNIETKNAIGKTGTVYLTIPGNRNGKGKVNIVVQECYVEFDAVTTDVEDIKTGAEISVVDSNNGLLVVTRKK